MSIDYAATYYVKHTRWRAMYYVVRKRQLPKNHSRSKYSSALQSYSTSITLHFRPQRPHPQMLDIGYEYIFGHLFVSIFFYEYIRTFVRVKFVCANIFGHSLVSVLECKTYTNIRIYSNIHAIFNTNTYSDICSCQTN